MGFPLSLNDTENSEGQNTASGKNNSSNILLIFIVVLLVAIILLLIMYYKTSRKLSKIVNRQVPAVEEKEKDVEFSAEKKIAIGEGTMMTVEDRKELVFFNDKLKFQMGELLRASAEALGHGIMGNSYKAMLNDGSTIVVKRLRDLKPLTKEEFERIVQVIANLKHPNLLPLLAYYHSRDEKLMLYRYADNGNLFSRLHGNLHHLASYSFLYEHPTKANNLLEFQTAAATSQVLESSYRHRDCNCSHINLYKPAIPQHNGNCNRDHNRKLKPLLLMIKHY